MMVPVRTRILVVPIVALAAVAVAGCAAGDVRFTADTPAGFWVGLWHGMISFVTLVIGIFSDTVHVYETDNTGGWYDFGFLLGTTIIWGSGHRATPRRKRPTLDDREWDEIGAKVEAKLERKIREWAQAEPDEDWEQVGSKAERKLKQRLREWAEQP